MVGEHARSVGGDFALHVVEVLDHDGHTFECARCPTFAIACLSGLCLLAGPIEERVREGVQLGIHGLNARYKRLNEFDGRELLGLKSLDRLGRRHVAKVEITHG